MGEAAVQLFRQVKDRLRPANFETAPSVSLAAATVIAALRHWTNIVNKQVDCKLYVYYCTERDSLMIEYSTLKESLNPPFSEKHLMHHVAEQVAIEKTVLEDPAFFAELNRVAKERLRREDYF